MTGNKRGQKQQIMCGFMLGYGLVLLKKFK